MAGPAATRGATGHTWPKRDDPSWHADADRTPPRIEPPRWVPAGAAAWITGVAAGLELAIPWWLWVLASLGCLAASAIWSEKHRHPADRDRPGPAARRGGAVLLWLAVAALSAGWCGWRLTSPGESSLSRYLQEDGAIVQLTARITDEPRLVAGNRGPFAAFGYETPRTRFRAQVQSITTDRGERACGGGVVVSLDEADHRLQRGMRVRMRGWLSPIGGPLNPGEVDYRALLKEQGVVGRLALSNRGNWEALPATKNATATATATADADADATATADAGPGGGGWSTGWPSLRSAVSARAAAALRPGLEDAPAVLGLLQTLLLGQTPEDIDGLRDRFAGVGLAHLLSISGAHLGILVMLVWGLARTVVDRPHQAAVWVLAVLLLYLLVVPWRVPVVRASLMAGLFFAGQAVGRRPGATTLLSVSAVLLLIWRPGDLYNAGFQLSFVTVWALLRYTRGVSRTLLPEPMVTPQVGVGGGVEAGRWVRRALADAAAVSVVATATATPLVAYHFAMINPWAVVLSVLALPVLVATLAVGYLKVLCGVALPTAGLVLSGPLAWLGQALAGLVEEAAGWPAATLRLTGGANGITGAGREGGAGVAAWWAGSAMLVAWGWMGGHFAQRKVAGGLAVAVLVGWVVVQERGSAGAWQGVFTGGVNTESGEVSEVDWPADPAARLAMIAVGDGSCFVLRSGRRTLVFDCGSQPYPLVGRRSVVPALRKMGVDRVDVLVVSHADLDHYNGVPDLVEAVPVERVWVSPEVRAEALSRPAGATAYLLDWLAGRGLGVEAVTAGDRRRLGDAELEVLWPPAEGWEAERSNDWSVVLSVRVAGRRLMLHGDVQEAALARMLAEDRSRGKSPEADVVDLPHHGSWIEGGAAWLDVVKPTLVLQSSGRARLRRDRWARPIAERGIARRITDRDGLTEVAVGRDGSLAWRSYLVPGVEGSADEAAENEGGEAGGAGSPGWDG